MMLQRPQLPDDNNQEATAASHSTVLQGQRDRLINCWWDQPKHDDGRSLNPDLFCAFLADGGDGAINQELPGGSPNRAQYPFLGSASGGGDDERTAAMGGGAAAASAAGARRKREACTLKPGNEGGDKRIKRDDVDGLVPKLESPPMSTITTAASDNCGRKSKASAPPEKSDYIHVRARRGQATDSHSLAERVRREKISKRMKILQDLVPGCSKIAGKAGMLDEIINYVQSLQRQVEFLSMKLAAVSPTIDFGNIDALFGKQTVPVSGGEALPHMGTMPLEAAEASSLLRLIPMRQSAAAAAKAATSGEMELPVSSAVPLSESWPFLEVNPPASPWEADLQTLYGVDFQLNKEDPPPPTSPASATVLQPPVPGKFECNC